MIFRDLCIILQAEHDSELLSFNELHLFILIIRGCARHELGQLNMKQSKFLALFCAVILSMAFMSSCSDDGGVSSASGFYLHENGSNFVNLDHNTFYHGFIDDTPDYAIEKGRKYWHRNGSYYVVGWYETYTIVDKQLILSNGTFGSIEGNKLYYGSSVYTKEK